MLHRVDISNYRTYAEHVVVGPFYSLSAIVGPNGSGKSNITSAIDLVFNHRAVLTCFAVNCFVKLENPQTIAAELKDNTKNSYNQVEIALTQRKSFKEPTNPIQPANTRFDELRIPKYAILNSLLAHNDQSQPRISVFIESECLVKCLSQYENFIIPEIHDFCDKFLQDVFSNNEHYEIVNSRFSHLNISNLKLSKVEALQKLSSADYNKEILIFDENDQVLASKYVEGQLERRQMDKNRFKYDLCIESVKLLISAHQFVVFERFSECYAINGFIFDFYDYISVLNILNLDTGVFPLLNPSSFTCRNISSLIVEELEILRANFANDENQIDFKQQENREPNNPKNDDISKPESLISVQNNFSSEKESLITDGALPSQLSLMNAKNVLNLVERLCFSYLLKHKVDFYDNKYKSVSKSLKNLQEKRRRILAIQKEIKANKDMLKRQKTLVQKLHEAEIHLFLSDINQKYDVVSRSYNKYLESHSSIEKLVLSTFSEMFVIDCSTEKTSIFYKEFELISYLALKNRTLNILELASSLEKPPCDLILELLQMVLVNHKKRLFDYQTRITMKEQQYDILAHEIKTEEENIHNTVSVSISTQEFLSSLRDTQNFVEKNALVVIQCLQDLKDQQVLYQEYKNSAQSLSSVVKNFDIAVLKTPMGLEELPYIRDIVCDVGNDIIACETNILLNNRFERELSALVQACLQLNKTHIIEINSLVENNGPEISQLNNIVRRKERIQSEISFQNEKCEALQEQIRELDQSISKDKILLENFFTENEKKKIVSLHTYMVEQSLTKFLFTAVINKILFLKHDFNASRSNLVLMDVIQLLVSKFDLIGRAIDSIRPTQSKYEIALSVLISNENLVFAKQNRSIIDCIGYLKRNKKTKLSFLNVNNRIDVNKESISKYLTEYATIVQQHTNHMPPFLFYAIDCIHYDQNVVNGANFIFGDALITNNLDFAKYLKYTKKLKNKIVTLDGVLFHKNGFITAGKTKNKFITNAKSNTNANIYTESSYKFNNVSFDEKEDINLQIASMISKNNSLDVLKSILNLNNKDFSRLKTDTFSLILSNIAKQFTTTDADSILENPQFEIPMPFFVDQALSNDLKNLLNFKNELSDILSMKTKNRENHREIQCKIQRLGEIKSQLKERLNNNGLKKSELDNEYSKCKGLNDEMVENEKLITSIQNKIISGKNDIFAQMKNMIQNERTTFASFMDKYTIPLEYVRALRIHFSKISEFEQNRFYELEKNKYTVTSKINVVCAEINSVFRAFFKRTVMHSQGLSVFLDKYSRNFEILLDSLVPSNESLDILDEVIKRAKENLVMLQNLNFESAPSLNPDNTIISKTLNNQNIKLKELSHILEQERGVFARLKNDFTQIKSEIERLCVVFSSAQCEYQATIASFNNNLECLAKQLEKSESEGIKLPVNALKIVELYSRDKKLQKFIKDFSSPLSALHAFLKKHNLDSFEDCINEISKIRAELDQINIKEPSKRKMDSDKLDGDIKTKKQNACDLRDKLRVLRTTMNMRFYKGFDLLNKEINNIYKMLYEDDCVNVRLVLENSTACDPKMKSSFSIPLQTTSPDDATIGPSSHIIPICENSFKISEFDFEIDFDSFKIYAMPPNKRYTLVNDLSGGEQTMVNVAIVLAFSKIKNFAFTIFDEIDGCLDVANTKRLLQYLQKENSSVIISHRASVVSMCDALVGIYRTNTSNVLTYKLD